MSGGAPQPAEAKAEPLSAEVYRRGSAAYDEVLRPDGTVREPWREWMDLCREGGEKHQRSVTKAARRFIRENGVSYTTQGAGGDRGPWSFDPVPWIFGPEEWTRIEAGVAQRVRLAAAILDDLYGEQRLLREGLIPLEIVYRDRGFLRPCARELPSPRKGSRARPDVPSAAPALSLAALDLARGPDGRMWVVNQRTDCPFGLGFALENRSLLSRILPSLFQSCHVLRLANFFRTWREELEAGAGSGRDTRVVILATEGQVAEFETAYLANYLGYLRAVPGDLTVRDQRVWLKTLGALDPLELSADSVFGVPGLLQAIRAGSVKVLNAPGSGILETPGLHPFLPGVARSLLKEELLLPSVATWWCGQPRERDHVLAQLSRMVIKGIDLRSGFGTTYGSSLSAADLADLRARILADPGLYVGQEEAHFSTVPCLSGTQLEPRAAILRTYALRTRTDAVQVLPGGLARASQSNRHIVSTLAGGVSKDVWVRSATAPPRHVSLWRSDDAPAAETNPGHLPSRIGESFFWTGRQVERVDVAARCLRRILRSRVEGFDLDPELEALHEAFLLGVFRDLMAIPPLPVAGDDPAARELAFLLQDSTRPGTLAFALDQFRRVAHNLRDIWSTTSLQAIEACVDGWADAVRASRSVFDYYGPLDRLLLDLTAFVGLSLESMTRDAGWALLDAGRRIERGILLITLLRHGLARQVHPDLEFLVSESVLVIADSLVTFRRRYRRELRPQRILELLMFVDNNPRSLAYQFDRLEQFLVLLPREGLARIVQPLSLVREARRDLQRHTPDQLAAARPILDTLLLRESDRFKRLSDELTVCYFSHSTRR